jgi:hypothetical protein
MTQDTHARANKASGTMTVAREPAFFLCRAPRCRTRVNQWRDNPSARFCCRGCFDQYFRQRCIVCERDMVRKTEQQLLCGKRKCAAELRTWPERYRPFDKGHYAKSKGIIPDAPSAPQEAPENQGFLSPPWAPQTWYWRRLPGADEDWQLFNRDQRLLARIRQEGSGWWVAYPRCHPKPPIEDFKSAAKRALSLARPHSRPPARPATKAVQLLNQRRLRHEA